MDTKKYNAVFISDLHLGTPACRTKQLLDFTKSIDTKHLYLVGDIIDVVCMRHGAFWKMEHNTVIQKMLKLSRKGTKITYIPGNHDYHLKAMSGDSFGDVEIKSNAVHRAANGKEFLVTHGDEFDGIIGRMPWLYSVGNAGNDMVESVSSVIKTTRRFLRMPEWSLSEYVKEKTNRTMKTLVGFDHLVAAKAKRMAVNGVILGHTHIPGITFVDGISCINCGCWTGSCTAAVELEDGTMEVIFA